MPMLAVEKHQIHEGTYRPLNQKEFPKPPKQPAWEGLSVRLRIELFSGGLV